jgi:serine/threonine-protein kinase RsbW
MLRPVDSPQITITFPAAPEFLRLARLTSADAGSRAGFDYEDIDDLRIAVSELCSLLGGAVGGALTLEYEVSPGRVAVRGHAAPGALVDSDLSRTIVEAVVDEVLLTAQDGVARFECTKRSAAAEAE